MTQCASMNLKETVLINPNPTLPSQFHERTGHMMNPENNPIQDEIKSLSRYAEEHKMKIKKK